MEDIKINRAELIELKEKLKIAEQGHKILIKKRDGLIIEFFKLVEEIKDLKKTLDYELKKSLTLLKEVKVEKGLFYLKTLNYFLEDKPIVEVSIKNLIGVKMPEIEIKETKNYERLKRLTTLDLKSVLLIRHFENLLRLVLEVLEIEISLKKILVEIESTNRKVNLLDNVKIPEIKENIKKIKLQLEEFERENFIRLKKIKEKRIN